MKELTSKLECLRTKGDFLEFMSLLIADLRTNPQDWENRDLESYLNAIMNWTEDMDGYYQNNNLPTPLNVDWRILANILLAATMYG